MKSRTPLLVLQPVRNTSPQRLKFERTLLSLLQQAPNICCRRFICSPFCLLLFSQRIAHSFSISDVRLKQWTDSAPNMPQWHKQWLRDTVSEEGHSKQNKPPLVCLEAVMTLHLFVCMCVRAHVYCSRRNHKGSFDFSSCICLSVWRWMCVTDTVSLRYKHWQVSTKCMSLKRDLVWGKRGSKEVGKSWGL